MATTMTNAATGGQLVEARDDHGVYYYLADGLGEPTIGAWSTEEGARAALYEEAGPEPDILIDERARRLVRCLCCNAVVPFEGLVPDEDDADAWGELARDHARDCEWVATRAHRIEAPDA